MRYQIGKGVAIGATEHPVLQAKLAMMGYVNSAEGTGDRQHGK